MPTRTARTAWDGTLMEGKGQVELSSSKTGTFDVTFPARASEENSGTTTPEELIGAAHSACYAMSLSNEIAKAGGTPVSLEVTADVKLDRVDGALKISPITLTVRAELEGLSEEQFLEAANAAKVGCPVSKALAGAEILLDAKLA